MVISSTILTRICLRIRFGFLDLLIGPVKQVPNSGGVIPAQLVAFDAADSFDLSRVAAITAAFTRLIIPPHRIIRTDFRHTLDVVIERWTRRRNIKICRVAAIPMVVWVVFRCEIGHH